MAKNEIQPGDIVRLKSERYHKGVSVILMTVDSFRSPNIAVCHYVQSRLIGSSAQNSIATISINAAALEKYEG